MASVTQKVPNYVLGISTQPDEKKVPGQVVDLVNGVPDVVRQLIKRPGSQLINTISPSTVANAKWFIYLPSYGFSWWLIGEVEELTSNGPDR